MTNGSNHDSDSEVSVDDNCNEIIENLDHPLWQDHPETYFKKYAITINVQPTRFMNKRQWAKYTHDQQKLILSRIENALRRNNPSIKMQKLMFEVCPKLNQIHFHALYEMPELFRTELEAYYARTCGTIANKNTKTDSKSVWRHLDIQEIYDEQGWIKYISKDNNK